MCTHPKNILITRLSAIGDCILTLPLAVSAKQLWPSCTLTWVVECGAASLLQTHPAVDRVIKVEKGWLTRFNEWSRLRHVLRQASIDLVLDPQGLTKSAMLGWLSGARHRVGFDRSKARELAPWFATKRVTRRSRHAVDIYRETLSPWQQFSPGSGVFNMPVYREAAVDAELLIDELQLGTSWMCINVGAGWPSKIWPAEKFAQLARQVHADTKVRSLVVWAGEAEHRMARQVVDLSGPAAVLAPATNLQMLAEMLRRGSLYVGGDTGPMHLAAAVGTKCVALMGPTWSDECGPYGPGHFAIQSPLLPAQGSSMRRGDNSAMQAISTSEVARACMAILEQAATISHAA